MINVKTDRDTIRITTEDGTLYEMTWGQMKELEKALATLRKLEEAGDFDKLEMTIP